MPTARIDDTLEMHYELDDFTPPWEDDAEAILLHHGAGKSGKLWYFWVPGLASDYRVLRPDARGFGHSSPIPEGYRYSLSGLANDLRLLLDSLGIEKTHLVGETVGGPVCLQFAYEYPDRTSSLTLCGAPYRLDRLPEHFLHSAEIIHESGVEAWATGNGDRRFGDKADPEMVRWYHHEMGKTSARTLIALFDYVPTVDLTDILPHIRVPTLVFAGLESGITPPDDSRFIAATIPRRAARGDRGGADATAHHAPGRRTAEVPGVPREPLTPAPGARYAGEAAPASPRATGSEGLTASQKKSAPTTAAAGQHHEGAAVAAGHVVDDAGKDRPEGSSRT